MTGVTAESHWSWAQGIKVFAKEVEAKTNGKIKFQYFGAAQLGRKTSELVSQGLAEGGLIFPSFEPDKMPLTSVAELPGLHTTACNSVEPLWNTVKEGGLLYSLEYGNRGIHPIYAYNLPVYEVQTAKKKISKLEDLAGMKIRANGAAQSETVRALGAVPVQVPGPELYEALTRGTVDGGLWLSISTRDSGLENALKYRVAGTQLGSGGVSIFAVSEDFWKGLDANTRKILLDAGENTAKSLCAWVDKSNADEIDYLTKNSGLQTVTLPAEENARWVATTSSVAKKWAADIDASGRPGTKILETFKSYFAK